MNVFTSFVLITIVVTEVWLSDTSEARRDSEGSRRDVLMLRDTPVQGNDNGNITGEKLFGARCRKTRRARFVCRITKGA